MGKIIFGFDEYLKQKKIKFRVIQIQDCVILKLDEIFNSEYIFNLNFNSEIGIGERGYYVGIENCVFSINFKFILNYHFEFYLYYDQLEYYIFKENKILKRCILEDYTEDIDEMIETFINYLIKDMKKLKIPYQERFLNSRT